MIGNVGELPTGTVTFLLTDIDASTQRWEGDADEMVLAMARHDEILNEAVSAHGGTCPAEQGKGDSVVAAFGLASKALEAALDAQRALLETDLMVRMALHTGEARVRDRRYAGPAIIRAARLRALARGGQIVVSQATRDLLVDSLPAEATFAVTGEHGLKVLDRPEPVYVVRHHDLPMLADPIPSGEAPAHEAGASKHNLPMALTSLIGRSRELDAVGEALRRSRLVTLTGPGGAGKTRLGVELARRQLGRRADGVWLVDLTAAADFDPAAAVARTLDVGARSAATPTESLRRYLADRDVLLVLDNCEHVINACAELTTTVLTACPGVHILATSRESLDVSGETVWRLDPLGAHDARRLFVARARQRRPDFIPTEKTDATIAALCTRLDHLPLAIELAAARVSFMSPAEILAGLDARLDALGGRSRSLPPRHRTVRATVEWSHALLDDDEQRAFRSLAVFVGGFDAGAAIAVAPGLTVDKFARLVDKSIITIAETRGGKTRYRLLETIREFAHERLAEAGELGAARERHVHHFSVLDDVVLDGWPSTRAVEVLDELEEDYGNVLAALEWAAGSEPCTGARLLFARRDLFLLLGQADGRRLADLLLERCPARDRHRIELLITAGLLAMMVADVAAAKRAHQEAWELSVDLQAPRLEGWARFFHGLADTLGGSVEDARPQLEAAKALLRGESIPFGEAAAEAALGLTYVMAGEPDRGQELLKQALAIQTAEGYGWGQGQAHLYLGITAAASGNHAHDAATHYREAIASLRPYRDSSLLPVALVGQADLLRHRDPARALRIAPASWSIRSRIGGEFTPFFRAIAERVRTACEAQLGDEVEATWTEGTRLSVDDAVALAFGTRRPRAAAPAGLSARELEVVRLVANGQSNKTIAAELHLSVRTVESHVRHVLAKVALDNRTQLATWVGEHVQ
jgi:predicted ATPase/class 3 adenylate cyclase/DNA-binding CsgD family transcriptional regulator